MTNQKSPNKILNHPIFKMVLGIIVVFFASWAIKSLLVAPLLEMAGFSIDVLKLIQSIIMIPVMIVLYWFLFRKIEKRPITELSIKKQIPGSIAMFVSGVLIICFTVGVLYLFGYFRISGKNTFAHFIPVIGFIFVAALMEELLFRGIVYRIMENWIGTNLALLITGVLFGLAHLFNDSVSVFGILSAMSGGLLLGILYTRFKNIWLPVFFHFGWNLSQSVLGLNISGEDTMYYYKSVINGPEILTGGAFGPESSIISIIILLVVFAFIYHQCFRKDFLVANN